MLQKVFIGVVATVACFTTAEDALGQAFYRLGGQQPWYTVSQSQSQPYYWNSPSYNSYYFSYSGQVALPGFDASGYAPRMRATLEPAVSMDGAAVQSGGIAAVSLGAGGDRENIRPAANTAAFEPLVPRTDVGAGAHYSFGTYGGAGYGRPVSYGVGCCGTPAYGYR